MFFRSAPRFLWIVSILASSASALAGTERCDGNLDQAASTHYLVAPASGATGLPETAREFLHPSFPLVLLIPADGEIPASLPENTQVVRLPTHTPGTFRASVDRGLDDLMKRLPKPVGHARVHVGSEGAVEWGFGLMQRLGDPGYTGTLHSSELVSKRALRRFLERAEISELTWPVFFDESDFATTLPLYLEANPNARFAVKYGNSSGMNGRHLLKAPKVLWGIDDLRSHPNKWNRELEIIVEGHIDEVPLPKGAEAWRENAFDAEIYQLDGQVHLKHSLAFVYVKNDEKMYVSDTLQDPMSPEFATVRRAMAAKVKKLGINRGSIHFEIYTAVDARGRVLVHAPVILGDPNFRKGGNGKYTKAMKEAGVINFEVNELSMLAATDPRRLHEMQLKVVPGGAQVLVFSFKDAPAHAHFHASPMEVVGKIRALSTRIRDTMPWTAENWRTQPVGHAVELAETVEVVVANPSADLVSEQAKQALGFEPELVRLMTPVDRAPSDR